MWNDELILINYEIEPDEIGNQKKQRTETPILCDIRSTTRNEFYNYGEGELRPEYIAIVNDFEYSGQKEAEFKGEQYIVTRTYQDQRDLLELTLSRSIQR